MQTFESETKKQKIDGIKEAVEFYYHSAEYMDSVIRPLCIQLSDKVGNSADDDLSQRLTHVAMLFVHPEGTEITDDDIKSVRSSISDASILAIYGYGMKINSSWSSTAEETKKN